MRMTILFVLAVSLAAAGGAAAAATSTAPATEREAGRIPAAVQPTPSSAAGLSRLLTDQDGDGLSVENGDCNDQDPTALHFPVEAANVRVAKGATTTTVTWTSQSAWAGSSTNYQFVSGTFSSAFGLSLAAGGDFTLASTAHAFDSKPRPGPGFGRWYLVRARNSCGNGTFGTPQADAAVVPNGEPDAEIDSPNTDPTIGILRAVSLAGDGSDDQDPGFLLGYEWDFGGALPPLHGRNPGNVFFPQAGTYTISLTVIDHLGRIDATPATRTVTVQPCSPTQMSICYDSNPCTDESCDGAGICRYTNNANPCNDGDSQTCIDVCSAGVCRGGFDITPPQITDVTADPGPTTAVVSWTTDEPSTSRVDFGQDTPSGGTGSPVVDGALVTDHQVTIPVPPYPDSLQHFRVSSADTCGHAAQGPDSTFITLPGPIAPKTDDFCSAVLDPQTWSFVNPLGDGSYSLSTVAPRTVNLSVPAGPSHDLWTGGNNAVRVMQPSPNLDLELEAKWTTVGTTGSQMQGILVEASPGTYIRFDLMRDDVSTRFFTATFQSNQPQVRHDVRVPGIVAPFWMRIVRRGSTWQELYSTDGATWHEAVSFSFGLSVTKVGVFAGNWRSSPPAPAFVSSVDYFWNRATALADCGAGCSPAAPSGPMPGVGLPVCESPTLAWKPTAGATSYDVLIDGALACSSAQPSCSLSGLSAGAHDWYVVARGGTCNQPSGGPVWSFQQLPDIGEPSGPSPGAVGCVTQHIDWSPTPGATSYDVELDGTLVCVDRTSPGCFLYGLSWGHHTWRVIAKNGPCTVVGPTWGFFNALFPSAPQPSNPPNGSSACSVQTLSWSPSLYAEWYTVELDDTVVCTVDPPAATSCSIGPLSPGQHRWKVYSHSFCEIYGNPGPEWSFTIDSCGAASGPSDSTKTDRPAPALDR